MKERAPLSDIGIQLVQGKSSSFGYQNTASGFKSSSFGYGNTASDIFSSAFGYNNTASKVSNSAFGYNNTANGEKLQLSDMII